MKRVIKASVSNNDDIFVWDGNSEVPKDVVNVRIEDGVTEIGSFAFSSCENLQNVEIPNSVTSIGSDAFLYCRSLTKITIPDSVAKLGRDIFSNCTSLKVVVLPGGMTRIPFGMFSNCTNLQNIEIPNSVTSIGSSAFADCTNLKDMRIPDSVTEIRMSAFADCTNLKTITIPSGVTEIGVYVFESCTSLTNVTLPEGITTIGMCAFKGCKSLKRIIIPSSVTEINHEAFIGCPLLDQSTKKTIKQINPDVVFRKLNESELYPWEQDRRRKPSFSKMKKQLNAGEIENLCYDSEYSEYIDGLYGQATDKLKSRYSELYIEPSVQAGMGGVFAWYEVDGVTYRTHWDYESECEAIEEMIADCKNEKELVDAIAGYIDIHLEDAEPSDDSDYDGDDIATL